MLLRKQAVINASSAHGHKNAQQLKLFGTSLLIFAIFSSHANMWQRSSTGRVKFMYFAPLFIWHSATCCLQCRNDLGYCAKIQNGILIRSWNATVRVTEVGDCAWFLIKKWNVFRLIIEVVWNKIEEDSWQMKGKT